MEKSIMEWTLDRLQDAYKKIDGVEYDLNKRWEEGIPHHPKSIELFNKIQEVDFIWNNDFFCWKYGGDGDNGEIFMYVLDVIFEEEEKCAG
jgi:hypothetical protein